MKSPYEWLARLCPDQACAWSGGLIDQILITLTTIDQILTTLTTNQPCLVWWWVARRECWRGDELSPEPGLEEYTEPAKDENVKA